MNKTKVLDWGVIGYQAAVAKQEAIRQSLIEQKLHLRDGKIHSKSVPHHLVLCEHPHIYTLGKSGRIEHLKYNEMEMGAQGIEFFITSRGGDITYHGPGQLVVYPILDLDEIFNDVHKYVRSLEQVVIDLLNEYGIKGERLKDYTGVWVQDDTSSTYNKICAIGVHLSRWVSMHGLALNVDPDLNYFSGIVPCGIDENNKGITSLSKELNEKIALDTVKEDLIKIFLETFKLSLQD